MNFNSDNTSGATPEILAALVAANDGYSASYGGDALMAQVTRQARELFEAPEAAVHLVATGTAANALALSILCPPWSAVFCHAQAHIQVDECAAPEFFTGGAKLLPVAGEDAKLDLAALDAAMSATGCNGVHTVSPGVVSISNVTELGAVYRPEEVAAVAGVARRHGAAVHMDGSRFANAIAATGASPADMTWRAGVDVLSFGGTKNGCLGVEAVVIFDGARSREFELRRKRAGHLFSKHRFLSAQMAVYLSDGLWLDLAGRANAAAARLAEGLTRNDFVRALHPVQANMLFLEWPAAVGDRLSAAKSPFKRWPRPDGREAVRLVTSWSASAEEIDRFLAIAAGD